MGGNILNIGKSGLFAAQVGLATTGHNIANANVAGYSRQTVVQQSGMAQDFGFGFVGSGTQVSSIKRYSDDFLNTQVNAAQSSKSSLDSYYAQISQIDNVLADTTSGLSPALQDFFKGVQDVASNPGGSSGIASRQAMMSAAETLAARFQGLDGRMQEIRAGVNAQITSNVSLINSYAQQIAQANDDIAKFGNGANVLPNDLFDKRDQLIADLNKQVKATVMKGDNNSLTVSIGSGQPLVLGSKSFQLAATTSLTDATRVEVGYVTGGKVTVLGETSLSGGELGGLFDFRANSLDKAQNSLGAIATGLALTFNEQHKLGVDQAGKPGEDFFMVAPVAVTAAQPGSQTIVTPAIADVGALTGHDYRVEYDGVKLTVTGVPGGEPKILAYPQNGTPQVFEGISFDIRNATAGESFLVRPTINGASGFKVGLTDIAKIAAGAPVQTSMPLTNTGSAKISEGSVDASWLAAAAPLPLELKYDKASGALSGFPAGMAVTVTPVGGTALAPVTGPGPVPFVAGANYSFGGVNVSFTGVPGDQDKFTISRNTDGLGDNRNARLLGQLQTRPVLANGASYQSAYSQLVSLVGNKTREVQVNGQAGEALLGQAHEAQQNVSGVNLDEEATNLLKYQQAYQAAGKVMQIASTMFDTLLSLGR